MAWLNSSINCCAAGEDAGRCDKPEKSMRLVNGQPQLRSPPLPQTLKRPQTASTFDRPQTRGKDWIRSFSRASSRGSFTLRRNTSSRASSRMVISAPYNFQHHTETSFCEGTRESNRQGFTKIATVGIEHIFARKPVTPLPEFGPRNVDGKSDRALLHMRSESALEFRIPRKPLLSTVMERRSMNTEELLTALANDSSNERPARLRADTEPTCVRKELDDAIERRSVYLTSRPTSRASRVESRHERRESIYSESTEPMPTMTKLPLHHPEHRPQTAPPRSRRLKSVDSSLHAPKLLKERPLPPPHSLSFSKPLMSPPEENPCPVFLPGCSHPAPDKNHSRHISLDSVTNTPKPVTSREGFYQCVENPQSVSSVSSMGSELDGNEDYEATSWSESPSLGHGDKNVKELGYGMRFGVDSKKLQVAPPSEDETRACGESDKGEEARWSMAYGHGRGSVGIAL
ncbi:hypothetical protein EYC84_005473 [Monilinia fructicola]|uniref:Uncharacterized protein n=1 Tax=Monilinia fructicola TaxID=38448 RepID=A0A5M9JWM1_MONFR|nr:hypothetical protein EYC84_005473 [Monilinia fructicola]